MPAANRPKRSAAGATSRRSQAAAREAAEQQRAAMDRANRAKRRSSPARSAPAPKKSRAAASSSSSSSSNRRKSTSAAQEGTTTAEALKARNWNATYERLKAYYDKHGHCNVPYRYPEDPSLGFWCRTQRSRFHANRMSVDQIDKLEVLGFHLGQPTPNNTTSMASTSSSPARKSPAASSSKPKAKRGRPKVNKSQDNNAGDDDEIMEAEDVTAVNDDNDDTPEAVAVVVPTVPRATMTKEEKWTMQYEKLAAWIETHGHSNVPQKYPADQSWANWVRMQRDMFNYPTRGNISAERIERLNALGFDWKSPKERKSKTFEEQLEALTKYRTENGTPEQPGNINAIPKGRALGYFLAEQRELFHAQKLAPEKIQQLEALGMDWTIPSVGAGTTPKTFADYYEELKNFHEENGNINVKRGKALGNWLARQRELKAEEKLSEEEVAQLNELGMDWTIPLPARPRTWEECIAVLKAHKEEHGSINKMAKGRYMTTWLNRQKELYHEQKLTPEQIAELDGLEIDWTLPPRPRTWEEQLAALVAFYTIHGHSNVPSNYKEDYSLRNWVAKQRDYYLAGKLDENQKAQLNALEFDWTPPAKRRGYEDFVAIVKKYKEEHGTTNIPSEYGDPSVYRWVNRQKELYSKQKLLPQQVQQLQDIGFDFAPAVKLNKWDENYEALKIYQTKHGDINKINSFYKDRPNLCHWVCRQRDAKWKDKLTAEQQQKLTDMGMDWSGPRTYKYSQDEVWHAHFCLLKDFQAKHGHCGVPDQFPDDPALLDWIHRQHVNKVKNRMSQQRIDLLQSIGFVFNANFEINEEEENANADADYKMPPTNSATKSNRVSWKQHFESLKFYKETHGDFDVPLEFDAKLAEWTRQQRRAFKRGLTSRGKAISAEKIEMLNSIDFNWDGPDTSLDHKIRSSIGSVNDVVLGTPMKNPQAAAAAAATSSSPLASTGNPKPSKPPPANSTIAIAAAAAAAASKAQKEEDRRQQQVLQKELNEMRQMMMKMQESNQLLSRKLIENESARQEEKRQLEENMQEQAERLKSQQRALSSQTNQISELSEQVNVFQQRSQQQQQEEQAASQLHHLNFLAYRH